jgi:hypothetical protein
MATWALGSFPQAEITKKPGRYGHRKYCFTVAFAGSNEMPAY